MSCGKYGDLESLHEQIRVAGSSLKRTSLGTGLKEGAAPQKAASGVGNVGRGTTTDLSDKNNSKSSTQVETLVLPQAVIPKSCELKLKTAKARISPLTIRVSKEQKESIRQKAQTAGVPVGRYVIAATLGADYKPPKDPELVGALLVLNRELTAQGNNLNQIAKHLNGGSASPAEGEGMLGMIGRSMLRTHKAIRGVLAHGKPEP